MDDYAVYANVVGLLMFGVVLYSRLFQSWIYDQAVGKQTLVQEGSQFILFFYAVCFEVFPVESAATLLVSFLIGWCCFSLVMLFLRAQTRNAVFSDVDIFNYTKEH